MWLALITVLVVLVEMFKAHLDMIQRKSANPQAYARETEKVVLVRSSSRVTRAFLQQWQ